MPGALVWEGPSRLDGAPIAVVATWDSVNPKTGDMIQTWIIRSDMSPHEASIAGRDGSVCGQCPRRHSLGGDCYVMPFQAPGAVYRALARGGYRDTKNARELERRIKRGQAVRLGAYGDPAAVPYDVWARLLDGATGSGYTHQWRNPIALGLRRLAMASVDSAEEELEARALGWRTFRALSPGETPGPNTVECLSDSRGMTCDECKICNGADPARPNVASVWIAAHGARSKSLPVVKG